MSLLSQQLPRDFMEGFCQFRNAKLPPISHAKKEGQVCHSVLWGNSCGEKHHRWKVSKEHTCKKYQNHDLYHHHGLSFHAAFLVCGKNAVQKLLLRLCSTFFDAIADALCWGQIPTMLQLQTSAKFPSIIILMGQNEKRQEMRSSMMMLCIYYSLKKYCYIWLDEPHSSSRTSRRS